VLLAGNSRFTADYQQHEIFCPETGVVCQALLKETAGLFYQNTLQSFSTIRKLYTTTGLLRRSSKRLKTNSRQTGSALPMRYSIATNLAYKQKRNR